MTTAKDLLVKAKDELKTRGIARGGWFINPRTGCEVCSVGALWLADGSRVVSNGEEEFDLIFHGFSVAGLRARELLDRALADLVGPDHALVMYNDATKTDEEIFALFDRAIELAEAEA